MALACMVRLDDDLFFDSIMPQLINVADFEVDGLTNILCLDDQELADKMLSVFFPVESLTN